MCILTSAKIFQFLPVTCRVSGRHATGRKENLTAREYNLEQGVIKMGTVIVLVVLAGIVALVIRSMVRDRKNGKSLQCGGDCGHCGGHCH